MRCVVFSGPDKSWWHFLSHYYLMLRFCILFKPCVKQLRLFFFISLRNDELTEAHYLGEGENLERARWWENKFSSTERLKFGVEQKKKGPPESFCLTVGQKYIPRWFSEGFLFSPLWLSASIDVLSISGLPKEGGHEPTNGFTKTGMTIGLLKPFGSPTHSPSILLISYFAGKTRNPLEGRAFAIMVSKVIIITYADLSPALSCKHLPEWLWTNSPLRLGAGGERSLYMPHLISHQTFAWWSKINQRLWPYEIRSR